jgi:hypothetical protein
MREKSEERQGRLMASLFCVCEELSADSVDEVMDGSAKDKMILPGRTRHTQEEKTE